MRMLAAAALVLCGLAGDGSTGGPIPAARLNVVVYRPVSSTGPAIYPPVARWVAGPPGSVILRVGERHEQVLAIDGFPRGVTMTITTAPVK